MSTDGYLVGATDTAQKGQKIELFSTTSGKDEK